MFLVRRKSDGKYWRNLDHHAKVRDRFSLKSKHIGLWADTPDGIKPFLTKGGARSAFSTQLFEKVYTGEITYAWHDKEKKSPYKEYNYVKHPEWWGERFELVPVKISIGPSA